MGHDRPYRFSFYSNSLPAVIHARSLDELPADGQTFEQLFPSIDSPSASSNDSDDTTWWLDILNPTDEEMKTLSKVKQLKAITSQSYRPTFLGVLYTSFDYGRYTHGRNTRKNRVVSQLLLCVLPQLRPGSI